jgi:hypothetical protein
MRRDGVILQRSAELISDLLVDGINDLLARKHAERLPRIAQMQTEQIPESTRRWRVAFGRWPNAFQVKV